MSESDRKDISEWRKRIDELDSILIRVLNDRAQCAIEIGKIKRLLDIPVYDPKREEEIIQAVIQQNQGPLEEQGVRRLFERIIDESRRIERITADRIK